MNDAERAELGMRYMKKAAFMAQKMADRMPKCRGIEDLFDQQMAAALLFLSLCDEVAGARGSTISNVVDDFLPIMRALISHQPVRH
jgi:hypothetical protein